jgi:hypothetical protein
MKSLVKALQRATRPPCAANVAPADAPAWSSPGDRAGAI